ncbi:unnamed protein product [Nezara viridula]|uniref:Uncharacterized protein n=1 Tax=Nezara viridula TaxID=85310 RepID=A0A9P0HS57_NEZVI|nr:unnamed protein product [Nezara viridula]
MLRFFNQTLRFSPTTSGLRFDCRRYIETLRSSDPETKITKGDFEEQLLQLEELKGVLEKRKSDGNPEVMESSLRHVIKLISDLKNDLLKN